MKRIETLTEYNRLAIVGTLNLAATHGETAYICPWRYVECKDCAAEADCDAAYHDAPGITRSFRGWLAWLCDDVYALKIESGYRVLLTDRINHYRIARPDGFDIHAVGQPLPLLPRDREGNPALAITDVFASRYGAVCILVEDTYSGEKWLYSDIL